MSPSDIGRVVWVRLPSGEWYGPCLSVDVGARRDFYQLVYVNREVAEVSKRLRDLLRFEHGSSGWHEIFIGQCPPDAHGLTPERYAPALSYSTDARNPNLKLPAQELPADCRQATRSRRVGIDT